MPLAEGQLLGGALIVTSRRNHVMPLAALVWDRHK
jgi:hypothetical protein